ncbi:putative serine protease K12H4.7 [Ostrinia nubilalis]|uniref:putative serine protease K12H4.7 n=1 Tax=Ostrinia nubilalis TaxID=29057 RepID=UPI0030824A17
MIFLKGLWFYVITLLNLKTCYGFFHFEGDHHLRDDSPPKPDVIPIYEATMTQPLDHFDPAENRTWEMYYHYFNYKHFKPGGPLVLYTGGNHPYYINQINNFVINNFAKEINATVMIPEHRFYGKSVPNGDMSLENLAYLSSTQALADLKNFIEYIKREDLYKNSKVVVYGGSYSGNLAAWARMLYPDLVDAALSSSAPLLAKSDFYEYLEVVGDLFKKYGSSACYEKVAEIFQRYEKLLKSDEGIEQLKKEHEICKGTDMKVLENQHTFFYYILTRFTFVVQNPTRIQHYCNHNIITSNSIHDWKWNKQLQFENSNPICFNYDFADMIEVIKENVYFKSWLYQTCTEFGYMKSTSSNNHPFKNNLPVSFFYKMCTDVFGPEFDQARMEDGVKKTNEKYGGLTPNVDRVVFVNGDMDPWHKLGVLTDLSDEAPARVIPDASHCSDLWLFDDDNKSEKVAEVREFTKKKLKEWIGM